MTKQHIARIIAAVVVVVGAVGIAATRDGSDAPTAAQAGTPAVRLGQDVCPDLDSGKIDTSGDPLSVTVSAPAGHVITSYCVKAGSTSSGAGVEYVFLDSPTQTVTITHPSGKAVSHYSFAYVATEDSTTTTTSSTSTTTTTTPPSTTTTTTSTTSTTSTSTTTTTPTSSSTLPELL